MLKFSYELNGNLCIVHAVPKDHLERLFGALTEEAYRQHVLERSIPEGAVNLKEISAEDLPESRDFRNAWEMQEDKIVHNMEKARDIHLGRIREERNKKLTQLDTEWLKASSQNNKDKVAKVEAEKQILRDLPASISPALEACDNVEDLKKVMPEELK